MRMFWLTLLPICGVRSRYSGIARLHSWRSRLYCAVQRGTPGAVKRFGLAHYATRMGVAAIPLIKANTKKVGHAASIVGMTVIGALVATYVR